MIARAIQMARSGRCNAQMNIREMRDHCALEATSRQLLASAMNHLHLSARAYDRILKISRTIADLSGSGHITAEHLAEAIQFRTLDREEWGRFQC